MLTLETLESCKEGFGLFCRKPVLLQSSDERVLPSHVLRPLADMTLEHFEFGFPWEHGAA